MDGLEEGLEREQIDHLIVNAMGLMERASGCVERALLLGMARESGKEAFFAFLAVRRAVSRLRAAMVTSPHPSPGPGGLQGTGSGV